MPHVECPKCKQWTALRLEEHYKVCSATELRWIQRYYGYINSPFCEYVEQCNHRADGMWVDAEGHAHDWCLYHAGAFRAQPMEEGICYAPTHS
jgi:hypothetical protein